MNLPSNKNWLIALDTIDSTNNYAMRLIQDGMAFNGLVVSARTQTSGKGQRGNKWVAEPGQNVAMSILIDDSVLSDIYHLSFAVPVAVSNVLQTLLTKCQVCIKWTNDIYVNDKKIAGILIENIFRGAQLKNAIVGIGINVRQSDFNANNYNAAVTSMQLASGMEFDPETIVELVRNELLAVLTLDKKELLHLYNSRLWKRNEFYHFKEDGSDVVFGAEIVAVHPDFKLELFDGQKSLWYDYGSITWIHQVR